MTGSGASAAERARAEAATVREAVNHLARGCRARTSHGPDYYLVTIGAALDALVVVAERAEQAEKERDEANRNWKMAQEGFDFQHGVMQSLLNKKARLEDAITEYLTTETARGDPIGPQWWIDCNERSGNYPYKARLARVLAAAGGDPA